MDTQLLRTFLAVATGSSFSAAAARLHLTQPAVSKRVALLEEQLQVRLFDRIGRRVTLTESGSLLLPRARRIVLDLEDAERELRDRSGRIAGPLALATSHHIGLHRLPPVWKEYSRRYPDVSLQIEFMDSEKAHEAVLQGSTELAVITLAPEGHPEQVNARRVWPDPLSIMVARDHPLAAEPAPDIRRLAAFPAVLPGPGTYTGQILQELFARNAVPLLIGMSTNYLETLRMLASIGLGWSVLPDSMCTEDLVRLEIAGVAMHRDLGYVYHRERSLSNAARAFIGLLDAIADAPVAA